MKKMIIVLVLVAFLAAFIPNAGACGYAPCPEPVTTTVFVFLSHGGTASVFPWPLVGMQAGCLLAFSPWLIMYYNHPECRDQPTMGDMAECVQKGGGK
ncbi:MAG: hypothetical protein EHM49_02510 [Deltaproteobacteria bacterium]|nr:MAG: hypothetical protein EHM49_02510 [Deltaproteobacteria bacterium]